MTKAKAAASWGDYLAMRGVHNEVFQQNPARTCGGEPFNAALL
jgi:hypothetical protein